MRILISANTSFNLVNFRMGLIRKLIEDGHEVILLAPFDEYSSELKATGCQLLDFRMDRRGTSPPRELATLVSAYCHLKRARPDVVLSYTIKNNVYLGLAARALGLPLIPNITGLGSVFSNNSVLSRIIRKLYKVAFRTSPVVFFQNMEDREQFLAAKVVSGERTAVLPGSGVDLTRFEYQPVSGLADAPVFLMVARLLWDKGIGEYVQAARIVRKVTPNAVFRIIGGAEAPNAAVVPEEKVQQWVEEGVIDYVGPVRDVIPYFHAADCIVLPSYYREGTPRALLEGAACGRPLITTDTPGCRNVVEDGDSGFLVHPRDTEDLSKAMLAIARTTPEGRRKMGAAGRALVEAKYDERFVIQAYQDTLKILTLRGKGR